MRFSLKIVVSAALAFALTVPQASAEPTNHPSSSYVQKKDKKIKIKVVAKGDCAQNPTTILITDSTTTCSIEISITPPKLYYFDIGPLWSDGKALSYRSYLKAGLGSKAESRKTSAKGKATANILKTENLDGVEYPITSLTEEFYVWNFGFKGTLRSNPIMITFQQSIPASQCGYTYWEQSATYDGWVFIRSCP